MPWLQPSRLHLGHSSLALGCTTAQRSLRQTANVPTSEEEEEEFEPFDALRTSAKACQTKACQTKPLCRIIRWERFEFIFKLLSLPPPFPPFERTSCWYQSWPVSFISNSSTPPPPPHRSRFEPSMHSVINASFLHPLNGACGTRAWRGRPGGRRCRAEATVMVVSVVDGVHHCLPYILNSSFCSGSNSSSSSTSSLAHLMRG